MEKLSSLDGLRALAALLVVAFHARLPYFEGGYVGVDIFFVLSGFLITSILVNEHERDGTIAIWHFWGRRLARLYPAMLIVFVAFWIVAPTSFPDTPAMSEIMISALYLSDYAVVFWDQPKILGHTWSLAVEMHFYLLWPFVVMLISGLSRRKAIASLVVLYIVASAWRIVLFEEHGWDRAYYAFDSHASGLVLGGLLALLNWRPEKGVADKMGKLALLALLVCANQLQFSQAAEAGWSGVVVELSSAAVILSLLAPGTHLGAVFTHPVFVRIGLWSYGLYLWHYPVARLARDTFTGPVSFVVTITISLVLAGLSYELIEKRITRWLQVKFFPRRPVMFPKGQRKSFLKA